MDDAIYAVSQLPKAPLRSVLGTDACAVLEACY